MMQWRRLTCSVSSEFLMLPLYVRGLFQELKRHASDDGSVYIGAEIAGVAVARMLSAHPEEQRRVRADVDKLIEQGFLRLADSYLELVGFIDEQRSQEAERKAKYRANVRDMSGTCVPEPVPGHGGTGVRDLEEKRGEEKRSPPVGETGPPARSAPRVRKSVAPKSTTLPSPAGPESPLQASWRVWCELYAASRRNYGKYIRNSADGPAMQRIAKLAVEHTTDRPPEDFEALLRHWFMAYLRDTGSKTFSLVDQRHALQFFERGIPTYGAPWSKPQRPATVGETMPLPEPTHERRIVRPEAKPDGVPAPPGLMEQIRLIGGQR